MAVRKNVTYKEPDSYFTPEMLKAAKKFDKQEAAKAKAAAAKKPQKSSTKKK